MIIELEDEEARLLYAVVLEKVQEHFSYANTSALAERLCQLADRFTCEPRSVARLHRAENATRATSKVASAR
ncbi:MAG TPA: hypothetical protein VMS18_19090 [Candidatus Binatia bacterium]|nr:hypothetical protein [Candidatus Binatia bacterium]